VRYTANCVKQLRQLEKDTAAPPPPKPAAPVYATTVAPDAAKLQKEGEKMDEARMVQQAADTLAVWIEDRVKEGLRQFPLASINNKVREQLSLPDAEMTMSALHLLVRRNILGDGTYERNGRNYRAYRVNPKLLNGGPSVVEAYEGDSWKSLPKAPAFDAHLPMEEKPKPKPTSPPAPKKQPEYPKNPAPVPSPGDFKSALIQDVMQDQEMVMTVVDMYITSGQYQKLAQLLIGSTDVEWCERVLRRVAEIAPRSE
jgi:hypothetical protein